MMVAELADGDAFEVTSRRFLFDTSPFWFGEDAFWGYTLYDVSVDDQRLLLARPSQSRRALGDLILVENFLTELQEKVGG